MTNVKVKWTEMICNKPPWVKEEYCEICEDCDHYKPVTRTYFGKVKEVEFTEYPTNGAMGELHFELIIRINQKRKITVEMYTGNFDTWIDFLEIDGETIVEEEID